MLTDLYYSILYQPILNLLVFFYNLVPGNDLGVAIILLTIVIKLVFAPFFVQSIKAQKRIQEIQPKMDELKEKYKNEKEKLGVAIMELYKKEKVNPLSSCLPLLIQLPFLIAVFQVFRKGLTGETLNLLYSFIPNPGSLDPTFLGIVNLSHSSFVMALLAGIAQFWQSKMFISKKPKTDTKPAEQNLAATMTKQMTYTMPILTVVLGASLPAGLTLYWFVLTLLGALQQLLIFKKMKTKESS